MTTTIYDMIENVVKGEYNSIIEEIRKSIREFEEKVDEICNNIVKALKFKLDRHELGIEEENIRHDLEYIKYVPRAILEELDRSIFSKEDIKNATELDKKLLAEVAYASYLAVQQLESICYLLSKCLEYMYREATLLNSVTSYVLARSTMSIFLLTQLMASRIIIKMIRDFREGAENLEKEEYRKVLLDLLDKIEKNINEALKRVQTLVQIDSDIRDLKI